MGQATQGVVRASVLLLVFGASACHHRLDPASSLVATSPVSDWIPLDAGAARDPTLTRCLQADTAGHYAYEELEPHAAQNPRNEAHLVAAWMVKGRGGDAIRVARSSNGGRRWEDQQTLPFHRCSGGHPDLTGVSDPWVAFGPDGRIYVSAVGYRIENGRSNASGLLSVSSTDGGAHWTRMTAPSFDPTTRHFHDNAAIVADPTRPATAYAMTTRYEPSNPERPDTAMVGDRKNAIGAASLFITQDGGTTWSASVPMSPRVLGTVGGAPQMVIAARTGEQYAVYSGLAPTHAFHLVRSSDAGRSWSSPVQVAAFRPLRAPWRFPRTTSEPLIAEDLAHIAIDGASDQLFVVFADAQHSDGVRNQVSITTSFDGGQHWTPPHLVADSSMDTWRPTIVALGDGVIAITYLAPSAGMDLGTTVSVVETRLRIDAAGTLHRVRSRVVDQFQWRPTRAGEYFLGDYFALLAGGGERRFFYARTNDTFPRVGVRIWR